MKNSPDRPGAVRLVREDAAGDGDGDGDGDGGADRDSADDAAAARARKVEEIRRRVAEGRYEIDLDALAERIADVLAEPNPDGD